MDLSQLKAALLKLLKEDEEFRYAVAGLIGLEEILRRLDRHEELLVELFKRLKRHEEELVKIWEELARLREDMMLAAFDRAYDFAQKRVQFGRPIIEFQLIQQKLAEMAQLIDISRLAVYRAHLILDEYIKGAVEPRTMAAISSITKVFVTENATKVIDHAIQILGGSGYMFFTM